MEVGCEHGAAGQDEAVERRDGRVHLVDLCLEARDLRFDDAQRLPAEILVALGRGEIGAEIEEVVLDAAEHGVEIGIAGGVQAGDAEGGVGLVDCTPPAKIGRATSELQSRENLVCRLLLEKKKNKDYNPQRPHKTHTQG